MYIVAITASCRGKNHWYVLGHMENNILSNTAVIEKKWRKINGYQN